MIAVAWWTCALLAAAHARIYDRCELALDLQRLGVNRGDIPTWVCVAYHESLLDTAAYNPGSGDHGLLQISELFWCGDGKVCGVPCSAFRDDDISDDVDCALQIHEEHTRLQGDGFLAWVVYPLYCKHTTKKYLADCDTYQKNITHKYLNEPRGRSHNLNFTAPYPKIEDLKPPYLTINSIIRDKTRYSASENFVGFKIDNIDDLKLPVFTTSTTPSYLSSSSITTNSTTFSTRSPATYTSRLTTTTVIPKNSVTYDGSSSTEAPVTSTIRSPRLLTAKKEPVFKFRVQQAQTTISSSAFSSRSSLRASYITTPPVPSSITTSRPEFQYTTSSLATKTPFYRTTTSSPFYRTVYNITTPKPVFHRQNSIIQSTQQPTKYSFSFKLQTNTRAPLAATNKPQTTKYVLVDNNERQNDKNKTTAQPQQPSKSPFAFKLQTTRATPTSFTNRPQTTKSLAYDEPQNAKTDKTTPSIFDLYLNPTKSPRVVNFQIPSRESQYKLRIFSGGTTAAPKHFANQDMKLTPKGGTSRNNLYRREV